MRVYCGCVCILLATAGPLAAAEVLTPGQKHVQEQYGKLIAEIKKTPTPDDDLIVAKQLLVHAIDASGTDDLRLALAKAAVELMVGLEGKEAAALAKQAFELAESISPMPALERAGLYKNAAVGRLTRAQAAHKPIAEVRPLAVKAVWAIVKYLQTLKANGGKMDQADEDLKTARALIFRYRLTEQWEVSKALEVLRRWLVARQKALDAARRLLTGATSRKDAPGIRTANVQLAMVYLEYDGDLLLAAKHMAAAEDPRKDDLAFAAAFQADPKQFDSAKAIGTVVALAKIIHELPEDSREKLGLIAISLCRKYVAAEPSGKDAAKARLLVLQVEKAIGHTADKKFLDHLSKAYGGLHCKLKLIDGEKNVIRVGYDFSASNQIRDFTGSGKNWKIVKGALAARAGEDTAVLTSKLLFRADRPLRISFLVQGRQNLGGRLTFYPNSASYKPASFRGIYGTKQGWRHLLYKPGSSYYPTRCPGGRALSGNTYRVNLASNGKGKIAWLVNGKRIGTTSGSLNKSYTTARCAVSTTNSTAWFDELTMEGTVIVPALPPPPPKPTTHPATRPAPPPPRPTTKPTVLPEPPTTRPAPTTRPVPPDLPDPPL